MDDEKLLREYVGGHSEAVFRELVDRHASLVYFSALRQVSNHALAEDITQAVFIILDRKAASLAKQTNLAGWLYRVTRFASAKALRAEFRRQRREQEAAQMLASDTDPAWAEVAPVLEEAMSQLGEQDRAVVLVRFFENKTLREVGQLFGISEDTAQKRVSRAITKLRGFLVKSGVAASAAVIASTLSANAAPAAPAKLSDSIVSASLGRAGGSTQCQAIVRGTLHRMLLPRVIAGLGTLAVIGAMSGFLSHHRISSSANVGAERTLGVDQTFGIASPAAPGTKEPDLPKIRIRLSGTPGLRFEVARVGNLNPSILKGVLPQDVSFKADGFAVSITVHGPGEYGFELFRDDVLQAKSPVSPLKGADSVAYIEGIAGGKGIKVRSRPPEVPARN